MASRFLYSRARGIFSVGWNGVTRIRVASAGKRFVTQEKPISRFPIPNIDTLPQDIQERMNQVEEQMGLVPNFFKMLAHRPGEFQAFVMYYDALMLREGNLTKAEKEMIVVATSAANNCTFCVVAHGAFLRIMSKNPLLGDQVATNWQCADLSERERDILEFAMRVCRSETVKDEHLTDLQKHGLDSEDAWDIGAIAGLFALANRMAHLTNVQLNDEFYLMGRVRYDETE